MSRSRWALIAAGTLVFVAVASQILIPAIGAQRIESRLTANGGSADVTLAAIPAARLLFGDGERFQVTASGLDLQFEQRTNVLGRLDGFSIVDVKIAGSKAGPFQVSNFSLTRTAPGPYHLLTDATTSPADLVAAGVQHFQLPGSSLLDEILGQFIGPDDTPIPIHLDLQMTSDSGRVQVISGGGTVAGLPTGPLAELITQAVVIQL